MHQIRKPSVYGASKLNKTPTWLALRDNWPGINWTARWPDLTGFVPDHPSNCKTFWIWDVADIQRADLVLCLAPAEDEKLRGALIECGVAIGLGKPVYLVGEHADFGTWQHHPLVTKFETIVDALAAILGDFTIEGSMQPDIEDKRT